MRIFIPEPSRQSTWVRPTNRDPRIAINPMQIVFLNLHNEKRQILQCLFTVQIFQVVDFEGILSKWHRLTVEPMLKSQYQRLVFLGKQDNRSNTFRHSPASPLTANIQDDRARGLIEEGVDNVVTLLPGGGAGVVVMVEDLVEPQLCLVEVGDGHWGLALERFLEELLVESAAHQGERQHQDKGFITHPKYNIVIQMAHLDKVSEPTLLPLRDILKIFAGPHHSYALSDSQLWAWGSNANGTLSFSTYNETFFQPQRISLKVTHIATGANHTFAWSNTDVYGWGSNLNYELGLKEEKVYPMTKLEYFQEARENGFQVGGFACGESHSLAVIDMQNKQKRLFAWGNSKSHQLTIDSNLIIPYPVLSEFTEQVDQVYAKSDYNIAMCSGSLYSWGSDFFGRLGMQGPSKIQKLPKRINLDQVKTVGIGEYHAAAVLESGEVYSWGYGLHGQLGIGRLSNQSGPTKMLIDSPIIEAACGQQHTLLLTGSGFVYSCGSNKHGALGHQEEQDDKKRCLIPKKTKLSGIKSIVAGSKHSLALGTNLTVFSWGDNSYGQLGIAPIRHLQHESSQTSIVIGLGNSPTNAIEIQRWQSGKSEQQSKKKQLKEWQARYKQFLVRKVQQQNDLMKELEDLLKN